MTTAPAIQGPIADKSSGRHGPALICVALLLGACGFGHIVARVKMQMTFGMKMTFALMDDRPYIP